MSKCTHSRKLIYETGGCVENPAQQQQYPKVFSKTLTSRLDSEQDERFQKHRNVQIIPLQGMIMDSTLKVVRIPINHIALPEYITESLEAKIDNLFYTLLLTHETTQQLRDVVPIFNPERLSLKSQIDEELQLHLTDHKEYLPGSISLKNITSCAILTYSSLPTNQIMHLSYEDCSILKNKSSSKISSCIRLCLSLDCEADISIVHPSLQPPVLSLPLNKIAIKGALQGLLLCS